MKVLKIEISSNNIMLDEIVPNPQKHFVYLVDEFDNKDYKEEAKRLIKLAHRNKFASNYAREIYDKRDIALYGKFDNMVWLLSGDDGLEMVTDNGKNKLDVYLDLPYSDYKDFYLNLIADYDNLEKEDKEYIDTLIDNYGIN
jgi:hypothetical protein